METETRAGMVALVGRPNVGKSTLMNIVGCLDTPTAGTYMLNNKLVSEMTENELADTRNINLDGVCGASRHVQPHDVRFRDEELAYRARPNLRLRGIDWPLFALVGGAATAVASSSGRAGRRGPAFARRMSRMNAA